MPSPTAADMPWRKAIEEVLRDNGGPMHYADIAQAIRDSYRDNVGTTPARTPRPRPSPTPSWYTETSGQQLDSPRKSGWRHSTMPASNGPQIL
jgi:hypothetical protein